ncbi:hypothetical protein GCM10022236_40920 [Microlunatus ginsengisoli]|uniref:Uncharacterized protein n=1 Tax=Microlunatus ginsengisoli TaxID=363863 RepID=A0ABP7AJI1_9ACTN
MQLVDRLLLRSRWSEGPQLPAVSRKPAGQPGLPLLRRAFIQRDSCQLIAGPAAVVRGCSPPNPMNVRNAHVCGIAVVSNEKALAGCGAKDANILQVRHAPNKYVGEVRLRTLP